MESVSGDSLRLPQQFEAIHAGQAQVEQDQIKMLLRA
jgi:hypothetical protein